MKRYPLFIAAGLVVTLLLVVVSGQAFSERSPQVAEQVAPTAIDRSPSEMSTIIIGSPMPEPPPFPTVVFPTEEPLPAAPELDPILANEQEVARYTFDGNDRDTLRGWRFGQIQPDPAGVVAWDVWNGALSSPYNNLSMYLLNDVLAIAPDALEGNGAIEGQVALDYNTHAGFLLGYADDQNYVVGMFGSANAPRFPGITLMHVVAGQATVLASEPEFKVDNDWHTLRLAVVGTTITMTLDGSPVATGTLATPLLGTGVGAYAGSDGGALFDNVRLVQQQ